MIKIAVGKHFRENHEDKHKEMQKMVGTDMTYDLHFLFMMLKEN